MEAALQRWQEGEQAQSQEDLEPKAMLAILRALDLGGPAGLAGQEQDHVEKSRHSLLQNMLSMVGMWEENEMDCY